MAAFIDNLVIGLITIAFAGAIILYMTAGLYYNYRKGRKLDIFEYIKPGMVPLLVIGVFIIIMGLVGEITWPLPSPYNSLFFDPYVMLGFIIVGLAICTWNRLKLHYMGFFALLVGIVLLYYGISAFALGLTSAPLGLLGLYLAWGVAGIMSFPVSLIYDKRPGMKPRGAHPLWTIALIVFWMALLLGVMIAAVIAGGAIPAHLAGA